MRGEGAGQGGAFSDQNGSIYLYSLYRGVPPGALDYLTDVGVKNICHSNELLLSKNIQDFSPGVGFRVYRPGSGESGGQGSHGWHNIFLGIGSLAAA